MTFVDSLDSIIMLYSYAGFPERSFALVERRCPTTTSGTKEEISQADQHRSSDKDIVKEAVVVDPKSTREYITGVEVYEVERDVTAAPQITEEKLQLGQDGNVVSVPVSHHAVADEQLRRKIRLKHNAMSNLSIVLTLMSILVAFRRVPS